MLTDAIIKMMGINPEEIKKQMGDMLAQYNATVKYFDEQQKRIEKKIDFLLKVAGHEYTAADSPDAPVRNELAIDASPHAVSPRVSE